ncbi:UNVERIFIED_CONTAM: hypothetical protein GTU68_010586 [Idotea baltica]|nr:hypothetical protein [Idotea baltica]
MRWWGWKRFSTLTIY